MGFLTRLLLGNGRLPAALLAELEAEGLVLVEENVPGSVRYERFRAPGRRHHGKITPERLGLGISERRLAVYCRSGTIELIDSPFAEPRLGAVGVAAEGEDRLVLRVDYDAMPGAAGVSGRVAIHARTGSATRIATELEARLPG